MSLFQWLNIRLDMHSVTRHQTMQEVTTQRLWIDFLELFAHWSAARHLAKRHKA
jgi:hypothetical protein